jgi:hypothetical protein
MAGTVLLLAGCGGGHKSSTGTSGTTTTSKRHAVSTISAKLSGRNVVPKGEVGASGTVVVKLDPNAGTACWKLTLRGVAGPLSSHVHHGKAGQLGPVVIPLGDRYAPKGCVLVPTASLLAVANAPGEYYVDVHSRKYLNGAVRGPVHGGSTP